LTTKIHMLADAFGRPLRIMLTGGEVHDSKTALALLEDVDAQGVIADKAYDSNEIRNAIAAEDMVAVIPSRRSRRSRIPHDVALYKTRNRIERCFNKLKHFRRVATRFDRRAIYFLAFIYFASAIIWSR
jgi:transposase